MNSQQKVFPGFFRKINKPGWAIFDSKIVFGEYQE